MARGRRPRRRWPLRCRPAGTARWGSASLGSLHAGGVAWLACRVMVMSRSTAAGAIAALALVVPALGACANGGDDRLVVYSGRTENLVGPLLEDFADETGIGIDVRYGDSADLALLIDEEGDRSPADVFISQSPGAVGYLDAAADGGWVAVGPGAHAGLQHRHGRLGRAARLGARPHGPGVRRAGGARPDQRLVPGLRHRAAPRARRRRSPGLARRDGRR